jgi:predicted LPLAT superfamily acyltransferase
MAKLRTEPAIADPDAFYAALMDAHRGLDEAGSRQLDARLVLLLANHVGDLEVVREAIAAARDSPPA